MPEDLAAVADTYSYAEDYLETYWGQATRFEHLLSTMVASGLETLGDQRDFLESEGVSFTETALRTGLRMLELYGMVTPDIHGYKLRLDWFREATKYYGGSEQLLQQYTEASA